MCGRGKNLSQENISQEFLWTTTYSEGYSKPLDGNGNGNLRKRQLSGAKSASGKQNDIFRDSVRDNLDNSPHCWSAGKQNFSIGGFFYGFAFLFLNFPYFSLETARNLSSRAEGALEEEDSCHGSARLCCDWLSNSCIFLEGLRCISQCWERASIYIKENPTK